jgi:hypothetical protein
MITGARIPLTVDLGGLRVAITGAAGGIGQAIAVDGDMQTTM